LTAAKEYLYIHRRMAVVKILSPDKLKSARGSRSRAEVVRAGKEKFTEQDLYNYEKGLNRPHPNKIPYLLEALGVDFDQVAEELTPADA
jgi:hypothetical protein